ncbi:MAG: DUF814 domain-containing protein [Spirochaetaceae bacterium]|nr:MAG: DUF814 domain-containing protein [Spirochaetaceae bacterium]
MSLNNGEIELILRELDLPGHSIQKVIQSDFRNLYMELFRPPGAWWLRVCLEHPRVRFHRAERGPGAKRSHQRFEDFLHAHIRGGRIVAAEHLHQDRIVRLEVLHNGITCFLYLRLWGTRANIVVTDREMRVLDAFFRKPREGIATGVLFSPAAPESNLLRDCRPHPPDEPFNTFIERFYRDEEERAERERLHGLCTRSLERRRNRLAARLQEIEEGRQRSAEADRFQHQGELILAYIHRVKPGDSWVDVEDYGEENRTVRITLDPRRTPADNAREFFHKASRARESEAFLDSTAANLRNRIAAADSRLAALEDMSLQDLRELARELKQATPDGQGATGGTVPGLEFESRGFRILVGRNARENEALLRRAVRGNDWWLHTRDYAGGFVFIRGKKGQSVPLEVLLDGGNLAVFFSKARSNGAADLYYTQVKHLRRPRNGPAGLVLPTQEKNLFVELDPARLRSLGIGSDLNLPDK